MMKMKITKNLKWGKEKKKKTNDEFVTGSDIIQEMANTGNTKKKVAQQSQNFGGNQKNLPDPPAPPSASGNTKKKVAQQSQKLGNNQKNLPDPPAPPLAFQSTSSDKRYQSCISISETLSSSANKSQDNTNRKRGNARLPSPSLLTENRSISSRPSPSLLTENRSRSSRPSPSLLTENRSRSRSSSLENMRSMSRSPDQSQRYGRHTSSRNERSRSSSQYTRSRSPSFMIDRSRSSSRCQRSRSKSSSQWQRSRSKYQRSRSFSRNSRSSSRNRSHTSRPSSQRNRSRYPIFYQNSRDRSHTSRPSSQINRSMSPLSYQNSRDRRVHSSHQKRTADSNGRAGRTINQPHNDQSFPLPEEKFQRRLLYLLTEIRDLLKKDDIRGQKEYRFKQVDELADFQAEDVKLGVEKEFALCKKYIMQIGGKDYTEHLKKAMQRCLTNKLMSTMNMKGKKNKYPFGDSNLLKIIRDAVLACHNEATDSRIVQQCSKHLKYAPERAGGVARPKE